MHDGLFQVADVIHSKFLDTVNEFWSEFSSCTCAGFCVLLITLLYCRRIYLLLTPHDSNLCGLINWVDNWIVFSLNLLWFKLNWFTSGTMDVKVGLLVLLVFIDGYCCDARELMSVGQSGRETVTFDVSGTSFNCEFDARELNCFLNYRCTIYRCGQIS